MSNNRFVQVYRNQTLRRKFYPFLDNVLRIYPADALDPLIRSAVNIHEEKENIYKEIQSGLSRIQSGLTTTRRSISALSFQRHIMTSQTLQLLEGCDDKIKTYVEIGTKGRYVRRLCKELGFNKSYLVTDPEPGFSPTDILERAGLSKPWEFESLTYEPISSILSESVDLVSIYIGVHHGPADKLLPFIASVNKILTPGGHLIMREHDCTSPEMHMIAGLAHDVFDVATGVSWEEHSKDVTNFHSMDEWESMFAKHGLIRMHKGLLQVGDPSLNTLVRFQKQ